MVVVAAPVVVRVALSGAEVGAGAFGGADVVERSYRGHRLVNPHISLSKATATQVFAQAENTAHTQNDVSHLA